MTYKYLDPWMHTICISEGGKYFKYRLPYNTGDDEEDLYDGLHVGQEFEFWKTNDKDLFITSDEGSVKNIHLFSGGTVTDCGTTLQITGQKYCKLVYNGISWFAYVH